MGKNPKVVKKWDDDRMSMSSTIRNGDKKAKGNFLNVYKQINKRATHDKIPREVWINVDLIKAIHQHLNSGSIINDVVPGAFRRQGTQVGGKNPLPAHYIGEALQLFSEWFVMPSHFETSGNLIAALAVFLIECVTIHPFLDGNGRVCRAVMDFVLVSMKLPPAQFKEKEKVNVAILGNPTVKDTVCINKRISQATGLKDINDDKLLVKWLKNDGNCANAKKLFKAAGNFDYNTRESWYCTN